MIKWGILGAGNIAHRFAHSLNYFDDCRLEAISGRNIKKLETFSKEFQVSRIYLDHDLLIKDKELDCIYIALPHQFHKEWIIKALENHKAVLCEKPAVLNSKDLIEIEQAAHHNNSLFMEALKSRFVPSYQYVRQEIEDGIIGELKKISTSFCSILPKEDYGRTYHTDKESRGVLYDTGVYGSALLNDFFKNFKEIKSIKTVIKDGIIYDISAELEFEEGIGEIECSFIREEPRSAVFEGSLGTIVLEDFYRAQKFKIIKDGKIIEKTIPYQYDDFYDQIKHFIQLYKERKIESEMMSIEDSTGSIKLLENIFEYIIKNDQNKK